jgi:hypothetical protein
MLTQVKRWLDSFEENYRRPGLPPLELSGIYALFPEDALGDFVESRWNEPYPYADRKGIYLIFGKSGMLLYVGKASMGATLGGRLGTYFAGKKECRLLVTEWTERPAYIATIAVPQGMGFEAPALEEYLIKTLKPCDNNLGISGRVPVGGVMTLESAGEEVETETGKPASLSADLGPGVYTYSAPGMPMCPKCEQRPAIFYCSTHQSAVCLECVAKHDERGKCVYVPAYRAPKPVEIPAAAPSAPKPPGTAKPRSIFDI